jgi:hypothetical protein
VAVVGVELLLEREDRGVALVEPSRERNHDVALLEQELLVPVDLRAVLAEGVPLALEIGDARLVLLADALVLDLDRAVERGSVLDLFPTNQELRAHRRNPLLELPLGEPLGGDLARPPLQLRDGREPVGLRGRAPGLGACALGLGAPPPLLEIQQLLAAHKATAGEGHRGNI